MPPRRLSAGHLKHRIVVQTPTKSEDGRGGKSPITWATFATLWARVAPVSSREAYQAGQLQGSVTHRIVCRYTSGVTPKMRVSWDSRVFQIVAPPRDLNGDGLVLEIDVVEELL